MDRFVRGLHVELQKEVLLAMPQTFDEACTIAEIVAAVLRFTRGRQGQ